LLLCSFVPLFSQWYALRTTQKGSTVPIPLLIDTDIGVDDAVALAWILRRPEAQVVGFTTVAGNTSLDNATANLLTLLDAAGLDIPVTVGADRPLTGQRPRTASLVHGPDGLWGAQEPHDWRALPDDAPAAIADAARAHPGLILVALGPLTNFALAAQRFPEALAGARLIALGGARHGGNTTPVAEFNIFADPVALDVVLQSRLKTELVLLDAFDTLQVEPAPFLHGLEQKGDRVSNLLVRSLRPYFAAVAEFDTGVQSLPDPAALIYALRPELATVSPAFVQVITEPGITWGQTVVALSEFERARMLLPPEEFNDLVEQAFVAGHDVNVAIRDALRGPTINALVVPKIVAAEMSRLLVADLCG
jgi:inosine-uridine nucleoside N-ribohydrolase